MGSSGRGFSIVFFIPRLISTHRIKIPVVVDKKENVEEAGRTKEKGEREGLEKRNAQMTTVIAGIGEREVEVLHNLEDQIR